MKLIDGYYAKDNDGAVYWFKELPEKGLTVWEGRNHSPSLPCIQIDGPWEDSLHRVEDGKITKVQTFRKDQPVLVSNDGGNWWRRHYSHYKDGKYIVFHNGTTSWTEVGTSAYKYIKPAEEE